MERKRQLLSPILNYCRENLGNWPYLRLITGSHEVEIRHSEIPLNLFLPLNYGERANLELYCHLDGLSPEEAIGELKRFNLRRKTLKDLGFNKQDEEILESGDEWAGQGYRSAYNLGIRDEVDLTELLSGIVQIPVIFQD